MAGSLNTGSALRLLISGDYPEMFCWEFLPERRWDISWRGHESAKG
jgi:hypothetical protein